MVSVVMWKRNAAVLTCYFAVVFRKRGESKMKSPRLGCRVQAGFA